jgi:hypothetical protein
VSRSDESNQLSSHALGLAFRVRSCALVQTLPRHPKVARASCAPSRGICPALRRMRRRAATNAGVPPRLCSASRFSQPLDALLRFVALLALFHASDAPGLGVYSGFPPMVAANASRRTLTPTPFSSLRVREFAHDARPRGFAHPSDPSLWAGVTRRPERDPLMTFFPSRYRPLRSRP